MVPILLCLGAWGWSRSHRTGIEYGHHDRFAGCVSVWGTVDVQWGTTYRPLPDGLWCYASPEPISHFWPVDSMFDSILGFAYSHTSTRLDTYYLLGVPWWFLILVFSAILYLVWRKTRPRRTGRAFPVELTAPRSEPTDAPS